MKKYIYGTIFIAIVTGIAIFFLRAPETAESQHMTLSLAFRFPENYDFTPGAPFSITWKTESSDGTFSAPIPVKNFNPFALPCEFNLKPAPGSTAVVLNARIFYCHKPTRMCFQHTYETRIPILPGQEISTIDYTWEITPKNHEPIAHSL